ncbi:hypothetical protein [Phascolarctobacterium sp.]
MIKVIFEQFAKDKSAFGKSMEAIMAIIIVGAIGCYFLDGYRQQEIAFYSEQYAQSVANKKWLEEFDVSANQKLLDQILKPARYEDVELIHQAQLDLLRRNKLMILNVSKGTAQPPNSNGAKKKLQFAETSVTVTGAWNDIVACLNEFEKNYLVVINNLHLGTNPQNGRIELTIKYRVYYE